jgi:hypothetical protein
MVDVGLRALCNNCIKNPYNLMNELDGEFCAHDESVIHKILSLEIFKEILGVDEMTPIWMLRKLLLLLLLLFLVR